MLFISAVLNVYCEWFACVIGMYAWKTMPKEYRFVVYYLIVVVLVEVPGNALRWSLYPVGYLYTAFLLFDNISQLYFANKLLRSKWAMWLLLSLGSLFLFVYIRDLIGFRSLYDIPRNAFRVHFIIMIIVFVLVLYKAVMQTTIPLSKSPLVWLAAGSLLFYGLQLGYFTMYKILGRSISRNQQDLLGTIANYSSALRYIFYVIGLNLMHTSNSSREAT